MEMADLQNTFWEARARCERIAGELADAKERFRVYCADQPGLKFRFTAVSERLMSLPTLATDLRNGRIAPHSNSAPGAGAANYPLWSLHDWRPSAFGAVQEYQVGSEVSVQKTDRWMVDQSGIIEVLGAHEAPMSVADPSVLVHPYWYVASAAHLLFLTNYIKLHTQGDVGRWIMDGEFVSSHFHDYAHSPDRHHDHVTLRLKRGAKFRPIMIDLGGNAQEDFMLIEDRIWASFGMTCSESARHGFQPPGC